MSYGEFMRGVIRLLRRAGIKENAIKYIRRTAFSKDDGKYIAKCPQGVTITGNVESHRVSVQWGSGHQAFATF